MKDKARFILLAVAAVGVLYLTIWPHELGHAAVAYLYHCKANWWQTDLSWYLWSSWGGKVDYDCLRARGRPALMMMGLGGRAVNLVLLVTAPWVGCWWRNGESSGPDRWPWLFLVTFFWALANYAEAFSYLVLNTIWLKSDMSDVVLESRVSRWPWLAAGVLLAVLAARWLRQPARRAATILAGPAGSSCMWMRLFVLYVVVVGVVMAAARISLT